MANDRLSEAYDLIQQDRLDEAQTILRDLVALEPDNADAWWLYAYATPDLDTARSSLNNVLRLDPDYPGAQELSRMLDAELAQQGAPGQIAPARPPAIRPITPPVAPPATLPGDIPEPSMESSTRRGNQPRTLLLVAGIILLLLVIVFALSRLFGQGPAPVTPTAVAQSVEQTPDALAATEPLAALTEPDGAAALAPEALTATAILVDAETEEVETEAAVALTSTDAPTETEAPASPTRLLRTPTESQDATTIPTEEALLSTETEDLDSTPTGPAATRTPRPTATATEPAPTATLAASATSTTAAVAAQATATTSVAAATPVDASIRYAALYGALNAFIIAPTGVTVEQTELGDTLLVNVCSTAGEGVRQALPAVMQAVARQSGSLDDVDALGTRLLDCTANRTLLVIGVDAETAAAFAGGQISQAEFERAWRAV